MVKLTEGCVEWGREETRGDRTRGEVGVVTSHGNGPDYLTWG